MRPPARPSASAASAAVTAPLPAWCLQGDALRERLTLLLDEARRRTLDILNAVPDDALTVQASPEHPPIAWVLGHLANLEERWVVRALGGDALVPPGVDALYDAAVHPPAERSGLPMLTAESARGYLAQVRRRTLAVLSRTSFATKEPLVHGAFVFGWVLQHEHRHCEALLETLQLLALTPALPRAHALRRTARARRPARAEIHVPGGPCILGTDDDPWALDFERPAHVVEVPPFFIDAALVTNAQYQAFIEDGGYRHRSLWSDEGWEVLTREGWVAPRFWKKTADGWTRRRFGALEPVPADEPVQHVSLYEAEAYARWAGRRLPTEAEWEKAAAWDPSRGKRRFPWGDEAPDRARANLASGSRGPHPCGAHPAGATPAGVTQLCGEVWEWTASSFRPWPGFRPLPLREANAGGDAGSPGHHVLRGGSWATHPVGFRCTTRRRAAPGRRELFAGFRCARGA